MQIRQIKTYIKEKNFEIFKKSKMLQDAIIRELEIIVEATKRLLNKVREKYKEVPWSKIAGSRDKLIHGYFGVDLKSIWAILKKDIPKLENNINKILENTE